MPTTIKLKNSTTTTAAPSSLVQGEAAVNITDKKVWVGDASSTPVQIIGAGATVAGTTGTFTSNVSVAGTFAANGGVTLGDASGDALTINSSAVSIPNGLNFDSNTFVIDAANNRVGVGTASPSYRLHVISTDATAGYFNGSGSVTTIDLDNTNANGWGSNLAIRTGGTAAGYFGTIGSLLGSTAQDLAIYATSGNGVRFYTNGNNERMRITSAGNVGIGTSSPATRLDVSGASGFISVVRSNTDAAVGQRFFRNGTNAGEIGTGDALFSGGSGSNFGFTTPSTNALLFGTNATERMRLDSSGNLGLGVTPSAWDSAFKAIQLNTTGSIASTSNRTFIGQNWYDAAAGGRYIANGFALRYDQIGATGAHAWYISPSGTANNATSFTQAMTLDASGRLGIGTSSPSAKLVVSGGWQQITNGSSSLYIGDGVNLVSGSPASASAIRFDGDSLLFSYSNTERMRIDSSGNLLVGKTVTTLSTVGSYITNAGESGFTRDGAESLNLNRLSSDGQTLRFFRQTSQVGSVSVTTTATAYNTSSDYRLKDNQAPLTGSGSFIDALQPKTWTWKVDGSVGVGFIAHEVQVVSPNSVTGEKDAVDEEGNPKYQAMEYGSAEFIANIIAELQDLRKRVAVLESK